MVPPNGNKADWAWLLDMKLRDIIILASSQGGSGVSVAPVLTWTSGTGTLNPVFTLAPVVTGDSVYIEIATDAGFSSIFDTDTHVVTVPEAVSGSFTFSGISTLAYGTTYYARVRINGGAWSNTVNKTTDAPPAAAVTAVDGVNKNQYVTVTGNTVHPAFTGVGQLIFARADRDASSNKFGFSASVDTTTYQVTIGIDSGAVAVGSAAFPSFDTLNSAGIFLEASAGNSSIAYNAGYTPTGVAFVAGDDIIVEVDASGATASVSFYRYRSGVKTQAGSTVTSIPLSKVVRANFGGFQVADTLTADFTPAHLTSGFADY